MKILLTSATVRASMALTNESVQALAHLARIGLEPQEVERAGRELETILGYVDRLQQVDTTNVDEASPEPVKADAFRTDTVNDCSAPVRDEILADFPATQAGMLKAPAVFERPKA